MRIKTSFAVITLGSLIPLVFLSLGIPKEGRAQSAPHTCASGVHQTNLGNVNSYNFVRTRSCPNYPTSNAVLWKIDVYNSSNTRICGEGWIAVPPDPRSYFCPGPLPKGGYGVVKVVISYRTWSNGSDMTHTELFSNQ